MEEKTLKKKIEIDLKVLAKIEKEKNPNEGDFHFQIVQVNDKGDILDESEDEEEDNSEQEEKHPAVEPESLAQE